MSVPYEKIVEEDLNVETGEVTVTMPGGGTATGHKVNPSTFQALGFAAIAPGNQSVPASTLTTVEITPEEFDTKGWFNPATYIFTPLKAGYYLVQATVELASFTGVLTLGIYKNAGLVDSVSTVRAAAAGKIHVTCVVAMNGVSDTLRIKATQTDSAAKVISTGRFSAVNVGGL